MDRGLRLYNVTELLGKSPTKLVLGNEGHLLHCMCVQNNKKRKIQRTLRYVQFIFHDPTEKVLYCFKNIRGSKVSTMTFFCSATDTPPYRTIIIINNQNN